jgi:hypothetical protein
MTHRVRRTMSQMMRKIILLCLFTAPTEPSHSTSSVVTPQAYLAGVVAPAQPTSSHMISHHFSASFPTAERKEKYREIDLKETKGGCSAYGGVVSLFLLSHGGVKLACIEGYARAYAKPRKSGVYDSGRVCYLSCARGSCISCSDEEMRHGVRSIL